jgi:hypothetical protein
MSTWDEGFVLEMKVQHIISEQGRHGCNFKGRDAHWHIHSLSERIINIDKVLVPQLPMMLNTNNKNFYKKPFKLNGKFMAYVEKYAESVGLEREHVCGPFSPVWYTPFNPAKIALVKQVMFDYGWIPNEWNSKKMNLLTRKQQASLRKQEYPLFINKLFGEQKDEVEMLVNGFCNKHFKNKSKPYMRGILRELGFTSSRPPTFNSIKKKLLSKSFWPTSPKIDPDKDQWTSQEHSQIAGLLRDRMQSNHRKSLMEGLLKVQRPDGKISGEANPCATPTARMRHKKIVNIPSAGSFYGEQCRKLFTGDYNDDKTRNAILIHQRVGEGERIKPNTNIIEEWDGKKEAWKPNGSLAKFLVPANQDFFVGGDGAGLELRMLTHYLILVSKEQLEIAEKAGNAVAIWKYKAALASAYEYRKTLLEGDIHSHNQKLAGLPSRGAAKGFIYSFLYGAGDALLGSQVGGGKEEGAKMRSTFLAECPCIPVLIEWAQAHAEAYGWVPGLDGRRLMMRRDKETGKVQTHKALNVLLQAAGSIVMKKSNAIVVDLNHEQGIPAHQVIMMHDEFQFSVAARFVKALRENIDNCVRLAGEYFCMEVILASDSMVGAHWGHTH